MLTAEEIKFFGFYFFWRGIQLDENKLYFADVVWPNGVQETLEFYIETRYEGYDDFPVQEAFLETFHNGFKCWIEIESDKPEALAMIVNLSDIDPK